MRRILRILAMILLIFTAVSALGGGIALIISIPIMETSEMALKTFRKFPVREPSYLKSTR
ncbi:hypothetical protein ACFLTA_06695 [Bacteroidota bacterium]